MYKTVMAKTSPRRKSSSPKRKSSSPKRKSSSTRRKSSSPKRKSSSPKRKSSSSKEKVAVSSQEKSVSYSGPPPADDSFFLPGNASPKSLLTLEKPKTKCAIGNKKIIDAQKFIETFRSIQDRKSRKKIYSAKLNPLPQDASDKSISVKNWPSLVDKRFTNWLNSKYTDQKYKPEVFAEGEDACRCKICGLPKRTGPWKGNFCMCGQKSFSSDSDNYYDFLNSVGFPHQKFIVDYFTNDSPYRGILVYHGLGSGKTCTAVALAEMLSQKNPSERDIICMLPASLKDNYFKDLLKCGNNLYRQINFHKMNVESVMEECGDEKEYFEGILHNLEYLLNEVKNQKYHFISYNASNVGEQLKRIPYTHLNQEELSKIPSYNPKYYNRNNIFNHKTIIVDECHDLVSRIIGGGGKGIWDKEFYSKIMSAQDCKIIFMSGTPIQNDIFEIAITMNILRGYVGLNKSGGRLMLFPNSFKDFHSKFVSEDMTKIINEDIFKRRLIGLISNFQSTKGFFPYENKIFIKNFMSDYQFNVHDRIKSEEKIREDKTWTMRRQKREKFRGLAVGTRVIGEKESSTYSVFSRQACNFVYPDDIYRPNTLIPPPEIPLVSNQDKIISMKRKKPSTGGNSPIMEEDDEDAVSELIEAQETGTSKNKRIREYLRQIKVSLQFLFSRYNTTLTLPNLGKYSGKMMKLISNIENGLDLQKDSEGKSINGVWNKNSKKWDFNLNSSFVSIDSQESVPPPNKVSNSKGPVFIYSFFKSVEGAEILSYSLYANGYVSVPETGKGMFDRSFPSEILDKVNSCSVCFHCKKKLKEHIGFSEKAKRLDADLMLKVDEFLPEGIAMQSWLDKSTNLVKRKSLKAGKSGFSVVDYVIIGNKCSDDIQKEVELEAREIYGKLSDNDTDNLSETGNKINKLPEPNRSRALYICKRISERKVHISNLWQLVSLISEKVFGEVNQFDWRGGISQEKISSLELKCPTMDNTFKPTRFVVWSGDSTKEMSGNILLNKFNSSDNMLGEEIKVMIATRVAGQGVSLMNVRQVHILEPHWNEAKIKQAIGRASRVCSHGSLPLEDRIVDVFRYYSEYDTNQVSSFISTDNELSNISSRKNYLINKVEDLMREMSIDCLINNNSKNCFVLNSSELEGENLLQNMYEPDIDSSIDIMKRSIIRYLPPLISRPISGMEGSQVILMISSQMGFVIEKSGLQKDVPAFMMKKILIIDKSGKITLRDLTSSLIGKDLMNVPALNKQILVKLPTEYYDSAEIKIKDLKQWPSGVWSSGTGDTTIVSKRPQALAFRKWQKDLYETNLK